MDEMFNKLIAEIHQLSINIARLTEDVTKVAAPTPTVAALPEFPAETVVAPVAPAPEVKKPAALRKPAAPKAEPVATPAPVVAPVVAPPTATTPAQVAAAIPAAVSIDEVRAALGAVCDKFGAGYAKDIITNHGNAAKVSEIRVEKLGAVLAECQKVLA